MTYAYACEVVLFVHMVHIIKVEDHEPLPIEIAQRRALCGRYPGGGVNVWHRVDFNAETTDKPAHGRPCYMCQLRRKEQTEAILVRLQAENVRLQAQMVNLERQYAYQQQVLRSVTGEIANLPEADVRCWPYNTEPF
jgi:hypothetical protein